MMASLLVDSAVYYITECRRHAARYGPRAVTPWRYAALDRSPTADYATI